MLRLTRTRTERVRFFSLFHYTFFRRRRRRSCAHCIRVHRRRCMRSPPAPPRTGVQHLSSTTIVARARKNHTYSIPTINHRRRRQEKLQREYYYYREKVLRHMQGCATRSYTFNVYTDGSSVDSYANRYGVYTRFLHKYHTGARASTRYERRPAKFPTSLESPPLFSMCT